MVKVSAAKCMLLMPGFSMSTTVEHVSAARSQACSSDAAGSAPSASACVPG